MKLSEDIGLGLGKIFSAATYIGSAIRDARVFHPEGDIIRCLVSVESKDPLLHRVGKHLRGPAILRFSGGIWKDEESSWDILGCALRLGWNPHRPLDDKKVQDLVLGTFKSLLTLPLAPLTTKTHDYLANHYYSVTPYKLEDLGKVEFRLVGETSQGASSSNRSENLLAAVKAEGEKPTMHLEIKRDSFMSSWEPWLRIELMDTVEMDDEKLFFSPFHDGKSIHPVGFINYIRKKTYTASRAGRTEH